MWIALGCFAVAALGGLFMVFVRLQRGENPPLAVAALHGLLAATGLALLLGMVGTGRAAGVLPDVSLGLLIVAALGGFWLLATHLRGVTLPVPVVGIHAGVAVLGFLALLAAALG